MASDFFRVEQLTKRFGGLTAVGDVSFALADGEILGIFGPNGSGKTTLLNVVSGIMAPTSGAVAWRGQPIHGHKPHAIAAAGLVKTFQNPRLFLELTIAGALRSHRFASKVPSGPV